jgi:hypothetical protein
LVNEAGGGSFPTSSLTQDQNREIARSERCCLGAKLAHDLAGADEKGIASHSFDIVACDVRFRLVAIRRKVAPDDPL